MITIFSNYIIILLIISVNTLWTKSILQKNQNLCIFIAIVEFKITVTNVEKDAVILSLFDMPLVGICLFVFCGCFYIKYHYLYPAFYFFHINITEIS